MFNTILSEEITLGSFLVCILTSIVLGLILSFVNIKLKENSKNFNITLAVLPVLVSIVIMMVNGNLGTSIAVLGSFSLIRFRSIAGNSKSILNVFFAMTIGLAVGSGYIAFAVIITLIVSLLLYILSISSFSTKNGYKLLKIDVPENLDYTNMFDDIFDKYLNSFVLFKSKLTNMGSTFELDYKVSFKNELDEKKFIDDIRVKNGNLKVILSTPLESDEL